MVLGIDRRFRVKNAANASRLASCVVALTLGVAGPAISGVSTNFNTLAHNTSILSGPWAGVSGATAVITNGGFVYNAGNYTNFVVYEGEISNTFSRIFPEAGTRCVSARLLAKFRWCVSLPDSTLTPGKQAGFCVSNGLPYAWSSTGWINLTNSAVNAAGQMIASNTWYNLGFVLNYSGDQIGAGAGTNRVYYKIILDETKILRPLNAAKRYRTGSPFLQAADGDFIQSPHTYTPNATDGIAGLTLAGGGAFDNVGAEEGDVPPPQSPLSASVDVRAYQTGGGVIVEFQTTEESGTNDIQVCISDGQGGLTVIGSVKPVGEGSNTYRIEVQGLAAGQNYTLWIRDESGIYHRADGVAVGAFATEMIRMSPVGITLRWVSIPERTYVIEWTPQVGGEWHPLMAVSADGYQCEQFVPFPDPLAKSGFFRIVMR